MLKRNKWFIQTQRHWMILSQFFVLLLLPWIPTTCRWIFNCFFFSFSFLLFTVSSEGRGRSAWAVCDEIVERLTSVSLAFSFFVVNEKVYKSVWFGQTIDVHDIVLAHSHVTLFVFLFFFFISFIFLFFTSTLRCHQLTVNYIRKTEKFRKKIYRMRTSELLDFPHQLAKEQMCVWSTYSVYSSIWSSWRNDSCTDAHITWNE